MTAPHSQARCRTERAATISDLAASVLNELLETARRDAPDDHTEASPHVLLGPVVRRAEDASDGPTWYFAVVSGTNETPSFTSVGGDERALVEDGRSTLLLSLAAHKAIIIHDVDDELVLVKWCAAIWPCDRTRRLVVDIQAEPHRPSGAA